MVFKFYMEMETKEILIKFQKEALSVFVIQMLSWKIAQQRFTLFLFPLHF